MQHAYAPPRDHEPRENYRGIVGVPARLVSLSRALRNFSTLLEHRSESLRRRSKDPFATLSRKKKKKEEKKRRRRRRKKKNTKTDLRVRIKDEENRLNLHRYSWTDVIGLICKNS